jgi:hypothetical protein
LAAIPWYAGAFLLFFVTLDHREKPGLIASTIAVSIPFAKLNNEKIYLLPYSLCSRIRKLSLFYGCCMHDTNGKIGLI